MKKKQTLWTPLPVIEKLILPFTYEYMQTAIIVCALVGGLCAFLSAYLMLKGWALIGDALAHAVVPGVALAYLLSLPYAIGAFFSGLLATLAMTIVKQKTALREDVIIGLVFTAFLSVGLILASINPIAINLQNIILGNVLSISTTDVWQVVIITFISLAILSIKWRDFMLLFFDQQFAASIGINTKVTGIIFFTLLSAATVTALQTVGACLVISMVITPGASAYLMTDRFGKLICLAVGIGVICSGLGAYLSFFLNVPPGGFIVSLQTLVFFIILLFSPKYGLVRRFKIV